MADITSFVTFHQEAPGAKYSPISGFHATCDTQLSQMIGEGTVALPFCPACKLPDMQALGAALAGFEWLRNNFAAIADGDTTLTEFTENTPGERPPVPGDVLRMWSFQWGFVPDEEVTDDEYGARCLIVVLRPAGGYEAFDAAAFQNCVGAGINPNCGLYLSPNSQGVPACPVHGTYDPEDDDPEAEDLD